MRYLVKIVQVYRVEREIMIEVEAEDRESAIEEQAATEAPEFNDPRWKSGWDLQNEEVTSS